jgi:hypothetical protein
MDALPLPQQASSSVRRGSTKVRKTLIAVKGDSGEWSVVIQVYVGNRQFTGGGTPDSPAARRR